MTFLFIALVVIVLLMLILGSVRRGPHARGLFTRKCPNCRVIINDRATVCPHCAQPTGFVRGAEKPARDPRWNDLRSTPAPAPPAPAKEFAGVHKHEWIAVLIIAAVGAAILAAMLLFAARAKADPLPLPKPPGPGGSCPHGWLSSGSYCVPAQGAQDAVAKPASGNCPFGWSASGSYCLRSGSGR